MPSASTVVAACASSTGRHASSTGRHASSTGRHASSTATPYAATPPATPPATPWRPVITANAVSPPCSPPCSRPCSPPCSPREGRERSSIAVPEVATSACSASVGIDTVAPSSAFAASRHSVSVDTFGGAKRHALGSRHADGIGHSTGARRIHQPHRRLARVGDGRDRSARRRRRSGGGGRLMVVCVASPATSTQATGESATAQGGWATSWR